MDWLPTYIGNGHNGQIHLVDRTEEAVGSSPTRSTLLPPDMGGSLLFAEKAGGIGLGIITVDINLVQSGVTRCNYQVLFMTEKSLLFFTLVLPQMLRNAIPLGWLYYRPPVYTVVLIQLSQINQVSLTL